MTDAHAQPWWNDVETDAAHAEAADWFVRLQDPQVSVEETVDWQQWMAADSRHREAFARIEITYREMAQMPRPALSSMLAGAHHASSKSAERYDGSMPVTAWLERKPKNFRTSAQRWRTMGIAAAGTGLAVALAWQFLGDEGSHTSLTEDSAWRTSIGENRSITLADGSTVTLGGASEVQVSFDAQRRLVSLNQGEAFFVVAKDSARPFSVRAGDSEVTALGTQFNVRRRNDRVSVAVVEGRVRVAEAAPSKALAWLRELSPPPEPVQLAAGEQTIVGHKVAAPAVSAADPSAIARWRTGQMVFDREPLREVLEDVNRYATKPIVVDDAGAGALEITGTVSRQDIDGWVHSLERAFKLEAMEEEERILVRRRQ